MISRRFTAWQKLTALAPVLLLVVAVPGQELLRCQMDGLLRTSCCCPDDNQTKDDVAASVIKAQGCCDRAAAAADHPPAETTRTVNDQIAWTSFEALATPLAYSIDRSGEDFSLWQSHEPPRDGPSVLLLKSAFLI